MEDTALHAALAALVGAIVYAVIASNLQLARRRKGLTNKERNAEDIEDSRQANIW